MAKTQLVILSKGPHTKAIVKALNDIPEELNLMFTGYTPNEIENILLRTASKSETVNIDGDEETLFEQVRKASKL